MKRDKPSKLVRWLFWLGVILVLSWIFLWSGFSFYKVWKIDRQVKHLERELSQTQAQNDSLRRENNRLKTDPAAAEEIAREKFCMNKPNETIWRFKPSTPSPDAKKGGK